MLKAIHPVAGVVALLTTATFWLSTTLSELFGSAAASQRSRQPYPGASCCSSPALAAGGGSGFALAQGARDGLIGAKRRRMPIIAANGALILIPSALFLAAKARTGEFDMSFDFVQALELAAGVINITLLGLNLRDGLRLTGRIGRSALSGSKADAWARRQ
jgi:hypothetical protein